RRAVGAHGRERLGRQCGAVGRGGLHGGNPRDRWKPIRRAAPRAAPGNGRATDKAQGQYGRRSDGCESVDGIRPSHLIRLQCGADAPPPSYSSVTVAVPRRSRIVLGAGTSALVPPPTLRRRIVI